MWLCSTLSTCLNPRMYRTSQGCGVHNLDKERIRTRCFHHLLTLTPYYFCILLSFLFFKVIAGWELGFWQSADCHGLVLISILKQNKKKNNNSVSWNSVLCHACARYIKYDPNRASSLKSPGHYSLLHQGGKLTCCSDKLQHTKL